mgnify:CR=1 FL=1
MENKITHVSKKAACEMLNISKPTLDSWIKNPKVKLSVELVGLRKRISVAEIEALKKELNSKNY